MQQSLNFSFLPVMLTALISIVFLGIAILIHSLSTKRITTVKETFQPLEYPPIPPEQAYYQRLLKTKDELTKLISMLKLQPSNPDNVLSRLLIEQSLKVIEDQIKRMDLYPQSFNRTWDQLPTEENKYQESTTNKEDGDPYESNKHLLHGYSDYLGAEFHMRPCL